MARGRVALLAALCLLISAVALHVEARQLPDCGPLGKHRYRCGGPPRITRSVRANPEQLPDCGPLGKHRYRCVDPGNITRSVEANPEQLRPTEIHDASGMQGDDSSPAPPATAHELTKEIANSTTSGAAHDGVAGVSTSSIAKDPECGPLEKNRFRCGNPPRIRVGDINALGF